MTELTRLVRADSIPASGSRVDFAASPAECAAIAARLGIPAIESLAIRFDLRPAPEGRVAARLTIEAHLTRDCVVSLEPFATSQHVAAGLVFVPAGQESEDEDPESDDEIPFPEGVIDLGEAAVEQLALDLDPYPRRPGATLPNAVAEEAPSPFAALAALRKPR